MRTIIVFVSFVKENQCAFEKVFVPPFNYPPQSISINCKNIFFDMVKAFDCVNCS